MLPIPFNETEIATPTNPINNQIYSFGYLASASATGIGCANSTKIVAGCFQLPAEDLETNINGFTADGNVGLRTKFVGINPNSVLWTAEGISNYNALEVGVTKKISHGLQLTASYTYSHTLDEGSGVGAGLFYNGNDPAHPGTSYADSDFDRPHVFIISYLYNLPTIKNASRLVDAVANGWGISGVTTVQSGEPFSIIDFSGAAGSLFYSGGDDSVTNPILPLQSGISAQQASSAAGGGGGLVNHQPYVNPNSFAPPSVAPGVDGVPPCEIVSTFNICDNYETGFGSTGRNIFRAPFESIFNFSMFKTFAVTERIKVKFEADAFNLFNHPDLDAPDTDFELNSNFSPVPTYNLSPNPPNSKGFGVIDETVGSSRFMQFSLHLTF